MQDEAKMLFRMKRMVDTAARTESPMKILSEKLMIEDLMGMELRKKHISGRAYGIIRRYLDKKIPESKYLHSGCDVRKKPRPNPDPLTEKEVERLLARSNDAF